MLNQLTAEFRQQLSLQKIKITLRRKTVRLQNLAYYLGFEGRLN